MKEVHEFRVSKPRSQTIAEAVQMVAVTGVMFYIIRPDILEKHVQYVQHKIEIVRYWISVNDTLISIRSLPETETDVTRNRED